MREKSRLHLAARLNLPVETTAKLLTNHEGRLANPKDKNELELLYSVDQSLLKNTGDSIPEEKIYHSINVHVQSDNAWSSWFRFSKLEHITLAEFIKLDAERKKPYLKQNTKLPGLDSLTLSGQEALLAQLKDANKLFKLEAIISSTGADTKSTDAEVKTEADTKSTDEEVKTEADTKSTDEEVKTEADTKSTDAEVKTEADTKSTDAEVKTEADTKSTDEEVKANKRRLTQLAQNEVETIHGYQAKAASNDKNMWKAFKSILVPCESRDEFKRFLLLSALGFLAILAYSLLRVSKDTMILSVAGAEVLPVLKFAVVLPATFAATYIWKKLVERFGDKALFVALLIFAGFFTAFFFALPHIGILQGATWLSALIPGGFGQAMQYWTYTLFYMMSELWAVVLVDGFLKSLQNQVLRKERLKEVLPTASLFQSVGLITSSLITSWAFGLTGYTLAGQVSIILVMLGSSIALLAGIYALAMYTGILKPAAAPDSSNNRIDIVKAKLKKILKGEDQQAELKSIEETLDKTEEKSPYDVAYEKATSPQAKAILLEEIIADHIEKAKNIDGITESDKQFLSTAKRTTLSEKLHWLDGYKKLKSQNNDLETAIKDAIRLAAAEQESDNQKNKAALEEAAYKLMVLGYINSQLSSKERITEQEALNHTPNTDEDVQKTALSNDITYLAWNAISSGLNTIISMYRFPLLRNVALCILGYNMSLVIFELVWKNQVKIYVNAGATAVTYGQYMSMFNMWTGIITIGLCLLGPVISKIPTKYTNLITPGILVVMAVGFFGLLLFPGFMAALCPVLFATSTQNQLAQIALLGLILNVSVKSTKYSTFEPGVAEANGVLPKVIKDAYQSTVNMINGKLGKAGASAIAIGLIIAAGTISAAATYIPIVLGVILTTWIFASLSMSQNVGILTGTASKPISAEAIKTDTTAATSQATPVNPSWTATFSSCLGFGAKA